MSREEARYGTKEAKEVIETREGDLTRLLAVNGKPLTDEQEKAEDRGIQKFIASPNEPNRQKQANSEDARKESRSHFQPVSDTLTLAQAEDLSRKQASEIESVHTK